MSYRLLTLSLYTLQVQCQLFIFLKISGLSKYSSIETSYYAHSWRITGVIGTTIERFYIGLGYCLSSTARKK